MLINVFYWIIIALVVYISPATLMAAQKERPIDVVEDNSFLLEEAYNQEPGTVQHIFHAHYVNDTRRRGWEFNFTQEWPIFSQNHQFSYTIPSYHLVENGDRQNGLGDVLLSYRYQLLEEDETKPAFAPSFSLILPSGSRKRGTGHGVVGYEWGLPFSKKINGQFALHANFGLTYLPNARGRLASGGLSSEHSLVSYNLAASAIYAALHRVHLMLEWLGDFEESIDDNGRSERSFKPVLSPGFRAAIVDQPMLQITAGAAAPIGLKRNAENYGAFLYLSIEHDLF
ncbi:MAG TPA: transporter [Candidatus Binatia bacterium]